MVIVPFVKIDRVVVGYSNSKNSKSYNHWQGRFISVVVINTNGVTILTIAI